MNQHRSNAILALLLSTLVLLLPTAGPPGDRAEALAIIPLVPGRVSTLETRRQQWPDWQLPAPLPRAQHQDLAWPGWFAGEWQVRSTVMPDGRIGASQPAEADLVWAVRFRPDGRGGAIADRAFNAAAIGKALLGDQLLAVQDDPTNPDRQLSRLSGERLLESTVLARAEATPAPGSFLSDELCLQVLHRSGQEPRVSQVEPLGRWQRRADGSIDGDQWQASYPSPAAGLQAIPVATDHLQLRLSPLPSKSDHAS
jgi:hypothetical protein